MEKESVTLKCSSKVNVKSPLTVEAEDKGPTNSLNVEHDTSEEEVEVFIGPAVMRLTESENPPDCRADIKLIGKPMRHKMDNQVCRYFLSSTGCKRDNCTWKHENPGDTESEIFNNATNSKDISLQRTKMGKLTSYFDVKMKELEFENNELVRKNHELEKEFLDLKNRGKDSKFLWKENVRLRNLLKQYRYHRYYPTSDIMHEGGWYVKPRNEHLTQHPAQRLRSRYASPEEYGHHRSKSRHMSDFRVYSDRGHKSIRAPLRRSTTVSRGRLANKEM